MKKHFLVTMFFVTSFMNFLEGTNPTASRVRGNQFTPSIQETQLAGPLGTLVATGIFGTNGSLSLAPQVPNAQAVAVQVLNTGTIAVVLNDGTNSYMVEYTEQGTVNSSFAAGTGNVLTLSHLTRTSLFLTVDEQSRFLLSGYSDIAGLPWIRRVTSSGILDSSFNFVDGASWTTSGAINQLGTQTNGYIVAVGFNGTNAMIARYDLSGAIDTSFGTNGYTILNGVGSLLLSNVQINNVVIDVNNKIYIAYVDGSSSVNVIRLTANGAVDSSWNGGAPVNLPFLNGTSMVTSELRMVLDSLGDLVVAVPSGSPAVIKAASITSATGAAGTFANFVTSGGVFDSDIYVLLNMIATSSGNVYFFGSNPSFHEMVVIACTTAGILDTTFNGSGVNFFYPTGVEPSTYALINAGAIAPSGQIFAAGAQLDGATTTPYLSDLYASQYAYQIPQFPLSQEQGTADLAFGSVLSETYPGVVSPFNGIYRSSLQQKAEAVIELISGRILIGLNGYTNSTNYSSMMLVRLDAQGILDGTFGSGGKLVLPNPSVTNEYLTGLLEDSSRNIYVTGYNAAGAIFRKYDSNGNLLWNSDYAVAGFQGHCCGIIDVNQVALFLSGPGNTGQINAYFIADGSVNTLFNRTGTVPGSVLTTDFGLDMGPLLNGLANISSNMYIAYKSTTSGNINVAGIVNEATGLLWMTLDIFAAYPGIAADDIRLTFNHDGNIVVAASLNNQFIITILNAVTGAVSINPFTVSTGGTSVQLAQIIGVSDDTMVLTGYDSVGSDYSMLVTRVTSAGSLDITFNSQGPIPGILSIQIGDLIPNYFARVASAITVQSFAGVNQGNLILVGYEQLFSTDATPMIMRIFGNPGTILVPNFPVSGNTIGTFDTSYNNTGIAITSVNGTTPPQLNQEVRAIRELTGVQIMTVVTDNNTSISYTERINANGTIDTTYGAGLGIPISKIAGTEIVQSMEFDAAGNFLVTGSNSSSGGFVKRILPTGSMDGTFGGGYSGSPTYPVGTSYGLMASVNACQQLTNGNIVIVGSNVVNSATVGCIQVINSVGAPVTSFGTNGQVTSGINATSVSVDPFNNIFVSVAYMQGSQINVRVLELDVNGNLVTSFGTNGVLDPAIVNIDDPQSLRLVFDSQQRIIVAASMYNNTPGAGGQVAINRFTPTGGVDTTFNGGSQYDISFEFPTNEANVLVTGLVSLNDNNTLVSGYQLDNSNNNYNYEFAASITNDGVLDIHFGVGAIPGIMTFQAAPATQLARRLIDMNVQTDGGILLCGGEVPAIDQETPLTFRLLGYPNSQPVPQFTGFVPPTPGPSPLNPGFNGGISEIAYILNLLTLSNIVSDALDRPTVGGIVSLNNQGQFVLVRYTTAGLLDLDFGTQGTGIVVLPNVITGLTGGYIALDQAGNLYAAGVSGAHEFVIARLTDRGILDTSFGTGGFVTSSSILNLFRGGFIVVDPVLNRSVIGGYTSDGNLVATRYLPDGSIDPSFASGSNHVALIPVPSLFSGGSIQTDLASNVFIGGMTSLNSMVAVKLHSSGSLDTSFGTLGIASTGPLPASSPGLLQGGSIAVDVVGNVVVGGLVNTQAFVVARFLTDGTLDQHFGTAGIGYSSSIAQLNLFGNVAIDSNGDIVMGGFASNENVVIARFVGIGPDAGTLDTSFNTTGIALTGVIPGLTYSGYVAIDVYDNIYFNGIVNAPFVRGRSGGPGLFAGQMLSGEQIFVINPSELNPVDLRIYYYGNDPIFLDEVFSPQYYIQFISDRAAKIAVLAEVLSLLATYELIYSNQPGWNLVWHLYRAKNSFELARIALIAAFASSTTEINIAFAQMYLRMDAMRFSSQSDLALVR